MSAIQNGFITSDPTQLELDFWEHIAFSFTMENDKKGDQRQGSSRGGRGRRSRRGSTPGGQSSSAASGSQSYIPANQHQNLPPMDQFLGPSGSSQPINAQDAYVQFTRALHTLAATYPDLQSSTNIPGNQLPSTSFTPPQPNLNPFLGFPWPPHSTGPEFGQIPQGYLANPPLDMNSLASHATEPMMGNAPNSPVSPTSSSAEAPSPEPPNLTDAERAALAEDKRRRNTAASARFRIKKKQKVLNLERSVSDLAGRAEELEREATELRRENGWLKEIIVLKSRTAGGGMIPELDQQEGTSAIQATSTAEDEGESESSEEAETQRQVKQRKGKKKA